MKAIFKREFKSYFRTPLGCIFIGVMYFFTAYYFFTFNLYAGTTDLSTLFSKLFSVVLFMIPILTARLFSEEKRSHTEQLLLTAPVSRFGIVFSKYLAALCVYLISISGTILMTLILSRFGKVDWPAAIGNFIGLLLLGIALTAICLFISTITESQVIAAVLGLGIGLFLILIDAVQSVIESAALRSVCSWFSFYQHYQGFTIGVIDFSNVLYYLLTAVLFLCLADAVLEKRRWN